MCFALKGQIITSSAFGMSGGNAQKKNVNDFKSAITEREP